MLQIASNKQSEWVISQELTAFTEWNWTNVRNAVAGKQRAAQMQVQGRPAASPRLSMLSTRPL